MCEFCSVVGGLDELASGEDQSRGEVSRMHVPLEMARPEIPASLLYTRAMTYDDDDDGQLTMT